MSLEVLVGSTLAVDPVMRTAEPRKTDAAYLYNRLRNDILSLALGPGTPLEEEDLARSFRVSRSRVRDALVRLANDGHVVMRERIRAIHLEGSREERLVVAPCPALEDAERGQCHDRSERGSPRRAARCHGPGGRDQEPDDGEIHVTIRARHRPAGNQPDHRKERHDKPPKTPWNIRRTVPNAIRRHADRGEENPRAHHQHPNL